MLSDRAEEEHVIEEMEISLYEIKVGVPWTGVAIQSFRAEFLPGGFLERAHATVTSTRVREN
jgi:hypothetical protein